MESLSILALVALAVVALVGTCFLLREHVGRTVHMLVNNIMGVVKEEEAIDAACLPPPPPPLPKGVFVAPFASETDKTAKWSVKDELGALLSTHKTQAEAEKAGRQLALANLSELVVIGKNGVVRKRNSYGT